MRIISPVLFMRWLLTVLCIFGSSSALLFALASYFNAVTLVINSLTMAIIAAGFCFSFLLALIFYQSLMARFFPLKKGPIAVASRMENRYHYRKLTYLFFWEILMYANLIPVPMRALFYRFLGAKIGIGTYPSGILIDPDFTTLGNHCVIGFHSKLIPHIITGEKLEHQPIHIGHHVTIGVSALLYGGVTVEDGGLILAHAVVLPNTHIRKNEVWGGVPAKKIGESTHALTTGSS